MQGDHGGSPHADHRGQQISTRNTDIDFVKEHIESVPKYQSHYSRSSNPNRHYLSPDLSITKFYLLYKDVCFAEDKAVDSEWVYRKIFDEEYMHTSAFWHNVRI